MGPKKASKMDLMLEELDVHLLLEGLEASPVLEFLNNLWGLGTE
jgi:hypothetical protein